MRDLSTYEYNFSNVYNLSARSATILETIKDGRGRLKMNVKISAMGEPAFAADSFEGIQIEENSSNMSGSNDDGEYGAAVDKDQRAKQKFKRHMQKIYSSLMELQHNREKR